MARRARDPRADLIRGAGALAVAVGWGATLIGLVFVPGWVEPGEGPRAAFLCLAGPLAFALAVACARTRPAAWPFALVAVPLIVIATQLLGGSAGDQLASLADAAPLLAGLALMGAAAFLPGRDERFDVSFESGAIVAVVALSLLGLFQGVTGWEGIPQASAPAATLVNRSVAGLTLAALLPLVVAVARVGSGGRRRFAWVAIGLCIAYLVMTRSRSAWVATAVGLAVMSVHWLCTMARPVRMRRAAAAAAIVLFIAALSASIPMRTFERLPSVTTRIQSFARPFEGTGAIRLALWRNGAVLIAERPWLGHGPGCFATEYPRVQRARVPTPRFGLERQPRNAENDPIEVAIELGIPAALALAALVVLAMLGDARVAFGATGARASRAAARMAVLAALTAGSLFGFPWHTGAAAALGWVVLGRSQAESAERPSIRGVLRVLLVAIGALATLGGGWFASSVVRAESSLGKALAAHAAGACSQAVNLAERAARIAPWRRQLVGTTAMIEFDCVEDPVRSLVAIESALKLQPHQINLLLAAGARRLKVGRLDAARAAFEHAVAIAPDLGRGWLGLAMVGEALGDPVARRDGCARALALDPQFAAARAYCAGDARR